MLVTQDEFSAGPDQLIVVYTSMDTGEEVDPPALFAAIAKDAGRRARDGWRIVSTADVPTRHSQAFLAREGSGYTTKTSIAVIYGR